MERAEYDKLDRLEDRMWWFAARDRNLLMLSQRRLPDQSRAWSTLDAGCGTGGFLTRLAARYPTGVLFGVDIDLFACRRAAAKSARPTCAASIDALPFPDGAFAVIFSLDVLCHRHVDERRALGQFHRCLVEHGWLILNLPAYQWLLSRHDCAVHNIRRYTVGRLRRLLNAAGFRCVYATYWNALLFPLMAVTRKLFHDDRTGAVSDVILYPRSIDAICRMVAGFESLLLRAGLKFPFGGSVLAVAAKGSAVSE
jgi:SAM-dependent methyltransferase